jgi:undecaprenyl diphosphate synthase
MQSLLHSNSLPEFSVEEFDDALAVFGGRERRFGKTTEQILQDKIEN